MNHNSSDSGYQYADANHNCSHSYLLPAVMAELKTLRASSPNAGNQLFDLGCGNGSAAASIAAGGWKVSGVDPSQEGIAAAKEAYPNLRLELGSAYDDLVSVFGRFRVVVSLEVVEHVYAPRKYAKTLFDLVEPGGASIISTPHHGFLKNLAMAVTDRMDTHFTALWDHGHIKFWSIPTLTTFLNEVGFGEIRFVRAGRIPPLAKSMIAIATKPKS